MYYTIPMMTKTMFLPLLLLALPVTSGEYSLMQDDTLEIPVAQYRAVRFEVVPDMAEEPRLEGSIGIVPDTSSMELLLLHIDDYLRWRENGEEVDTLAYRKLVSGDFSMEVPGLGSYALVVSNRGNYRPALVVMNIDLLFSGRGSGDPLPSALKLALLLIALGAVAFAIGSILVRNHR